MLVSAPLYRKPDVPTLTCPVHPDRPMELYGQSHYMQVWYCNGCRALPRKKRRLFSGVFVVHKQAGLRVPTREEIIEAAVRKEAQRVDEARDLELRMEERERLAKGYPTADAERLAGELRRAG